jgi:E3 ubiquitin-protein ligase HERC2
MVSHIVPHTDRPVPAVPSGRVFSFGRWNCGCLGHGSGGSQLDPKEVEALRGVDVASVSAGGWRVLALTYTGGVYSWGKYGLPLGHGGPSSEARPLGDMSTSLPTRIEALRGVRVRCIAAGQRHCCAATDEGHVYTWGRGWTGALGHMEFGDEPLPRRVEMLYYTGVVRWALRLVRSTRWWRMQTGPSGASVV